MFRYRWSIVFAAASAIYALTSAPSITGGDAGELLTASWGLGVAHPPGYPLWSMLGFLFAKLLPVGEVAWRYNWLSGLCNAGAAVILGRLVEKITREFWPGLFTASLLCFSPLLWRYSIVTEVFGLNQLLVAAWLALLWDHLGTPTVRSWALLCLFAGLGVSHHHTSAMVTAPLLLVLLWRERALVTSRLAHALLWGFVGLLPYGYLIWAAQSVPRMAWGDTSTFSGMVFHFLRREYGTFQLGNELTGHANEVLLRLGYFLKDLPANSLGGIGAWLGFLAFRQALRQKPEQYRQFVLLSGIGCASYLLIFCYLANLSLDKPLGELVQARFWLLGLLFTSLWAGLGAALIRKQVLKRNLALAALVILIPAGITLENQRSTTQFRDYARTLLESLPKDSILFFEGDHAYGALYYVQQVMGIRPDIQILHLNFLSRPWSRRWAAANYPSVTIPLKGIGLYGAPGFQIRDLVEANRRPGREIFVLNGIRAWEKSLEGVYTRAPWGMAEWIIPQTLPPQEAFGIWKKASDEFFKAFAAPWKPGWPLGDEKGQHWENIVAGEYLDARHNFAVALANQVQSGQADLGLSREALAHLEYMKPVYPAAHPAFWKNYGLVLHQLMQLDPSLKPKVVDAWSLYLRNKTAPDPQEPALRGIISGLERELGR